MKFWPDAFATSVFLIYKLPTKVLQVKSPTEVLFNKQPHYQSLKVFGCLCFPCLRQYNAHKLNVISSPYTYLGYANNIKGYKCLHSKGRIFISRHVIFNENMFPFYEKEIKTTQKIYNSKFSIPLIPLNHEEITQIHE